MYIYMVWISDVRLIGTSDTHILFIFACDQQIPQQVDLYVCCGERIFFFIINIQKLPLWFSYSESSRLIRICVELAFDVIRTCVQRFRCTIRPSVRPNSQIGAGIFMAARDSE